MDKLYDLTRNDGWLGGGGERWCVKDEEGEAAGRVEGVWHAKAVLTVLGLCTRFP